MGVDLLNVRDLEKLDHDGPVVMVNLMRFRELAMTWGESGSPDYAALHPRYGASATADQPPRGRPIAPDGRPRWSAVRGLASQTSDSSSAQRSCRRRSRARGAMRSSRRRRRP